MWRRSVMILVKTQLAAGHRSLSNERAQQTADAFLSFLFFLFLFTLSFLELLILIFVGIQVGKWN